MLRGMIGSIIDHMAGGDKAVAEAVRVEPKLIQRIADPGLVVAMEEIQQDPDQLDKYQDTPEVLDLLDHLAAIAGGPAYQIQSEWESTLVPPVAAELPDDFDEEDEEMRRKFEEEARMKLAEMQRLKAERARSALVSRSAPLTYDLKDWSRIPWFQRAQQLNHALGSKGFCLLEGSLPTDSLQAAVSEAQQLRAAGGFSRPPREVLSGLFGRSGSAWTRDLADPNKPAPVEEEALRKIDDVLSELGSEISGVPNPSSLPVEGRTVAVAHLSRSDFDRDNPPLITGEEADRYIMLFMRKKLKLIYYVGLSIAILRIHPIEHGELVYKTTMEAGTIIAIRGDMCRCSIEPISPQSGLTVEIDFLGHEKKGPQEAMRDRVLPPWELVNWYHVRLQAIVENEEGKDLPEHWAKLARTHFFRDHQRMPVFIMDAAQTLPTVACKDWSNHFAAAIIGGNDPVQEIPFSRWDMNLYYDKDPDNMENFKMYTRHMGMIPTDPGYDLKDFNMTTEEAAGCDPRYLRICESMMATLSKVGFTKETTRGHPLGVFAGLSGNEMMYQLASGQVKVSNLAYVNSTNAGSVNRLTYLLGSVGPSLCVDTEDSSGSAAFDSCITYFRSEKCSSGIVAGANVVHHPLTLIQLCSTGTVSESGRSRVFDESSDGKVRSEGVATFFLAAANEEVENALSRVRGTALNSKGFSASLTSPNGPSIADVVHRALKDAGCPSPIVDAAELNANGFALSDMVELSVTKQALDAQDDSMVVLRGFKAVHGDVGAPNGLIGVYNAIFLQRHSVHGPSLHLREFSELSDFPTDKESVGKEVNKFAISTEHLEAPSPGQHVGVSAFSATGTNVHHIIYGIKAELLHSNSAPIHWFPNTNDVEMEEASDTDAMLLKADFFIVGTWSAWQKPEPMKEESPKVWSSVIKLGINRFESFQILINGDVDQVLHPAGHWVTAQHGPVLGPSVAAHCGRLHTWCINGVPEKVRLINQKQFRALVKKSQEREEPVLPVDLETRCKLRVAFEGDYKPPGYEDAESIEDMPLMEQDIDLHGMPGDLYKVRLLLSGGGKYKKVEWEKLPASSLPDIEEYTHTYHLVGDFSQWFFEPAMEVKEEGVYVGRMQLVDTYTDFQIARDKDWDQLLYPTHGHDQDAIIHGPHPMGFGKFWRAEGEPGDLFEVCFKRRVLSGGQEGQKEPMSISWQYIANKTLPPEQVFKYSVITSSNEFNELMDMEPLEEDREVYTSDITIGTSCTEGFQIILDGNWASVIHPNRRTSSFREPGHEVQGPDHRGTTYLWVIGKDDVDKAKPGDVFRIFMRVMAGGRPVDLRWKKIHSAPEPAPEPAPGPPMPEPSAPEPPTLEPPTPEPSAPESPVAVEPLTTAGAEQSELQTVLPPGSPKSVPEVGVQATEAAQDANEEAQAMADMEELNALLEIGSDEGFDGPT